MSLRDEFYGLIVPDFNEKMMELKNTEKTIVDLKQEKIDTELMVEAGKKARIIFQDIAQQTQKNLEDHISNLVSLALKSVSPEFPDFVAEMTIRRNQLECDLWFENYGNRTRPMYSSGGGPKDVASFALFVSYWAMGNNRGCLVLDEPFKYVSPDLQGNVGDMIRMISDKLKLQLIMVSHADTVNESADKEFFVKLDGEVSLIE
jgi:ABC-type transporter Mla maintaining outer membrane lipid asymmetry ATPase subunit MlaF